MEFFHSRSLKILAILFVQHTAMRPHIKAHLVPLCLNSTAYSLLCWDCSCIRLHCLYTTFQFCKTGFLSSKLGYVDLELPAHPEKTTKQCQKQSDKHIKQTHSTHKDREVQRMPKHLNQNSKTEGSGRVQRQFKFKFKTTSTKFQEHTTNMLCYDPQLQGYFIWHCHLSHDPLAATSLDHTSTLVQNKEQQQTTEKLQKPSNESTSVQLVTTDIKTDNSS